MTDVTDADFQTAVIDRSNEVPVVVDLWAEWCGPCKTLGPIIEQVVADTGGKVELAKVDVDANPGLSQAYQIMSIPTIAYFKPGDQPKGVVGFQPMEQLEKKFGLDELSAPAGGAMPRASANLTERNIGSNDLSRSNPPRCWRR